MKSVTLSSPSHLSGTARPGVLEGFARKAVLKQLQKLKTGSIRVMDGDQSQRIGAAEGKAGLFATIKVLNPRFYGDVAFGGSIGAGEAYMRGYWECDDLVSLVRILLKNRQVLEGMDSGSGRLTAPLQKLFHWINRNTREGARRNISAHYDLGNDFFRLWLDQSMMYSAAIFQTAETSLAAAQQFRLQEICRKLDLKPSDRIMEIGTGWGGFAIYAAGNYGCRVTTTTISKEQYEYAQQRIQEAGLEDKITLLLKDFRDLSGQYDKLVSIEMIEAIGLDLIDPYFRKCGELLKPGGKLLIQAITIADQQFDQYKKGVDFIQRYIFPGSLLPSLSLMINSIKRKSDLQVTSLDDIGPHYATTLNHWRNNFFNKIDEIRKLGYPDEFIRMWEFYFCYCEGGFLERAISDVHLMAERPVI